MKHLVLEPVALTVGPAWAVCVAFNLHRSDGISEHYGADASSSDLTFALSVALSWWAVRLGRATLWVPRRLPAAVGAGGWIALPWLPPAATSKEAMTGVVLVSHGLAKSRPTAKRLVPDGTPGFGA